MDRSQKKFIRRKCRWKNVDIQRVIISIKY